ncbi:unnamed protein product [Darwinula stevensoni]|uniref:G-protein coupled receptors family 1 profile domain-containing protein n=1 Tax=Darwinula stevensoni TaxID=69355 RepID=A0A7R9A9P5_9CRUS|nr:unnamed protein product [Darwinula stevensoni]CAG0897635.1 unnamed protein product [Darwinula stevensoni]
MEEELPALLDNLWNETIQSENFQHGHAMTSTLCILFGAVFLLGFVGNLLVMMVIVRKRHIHNTPYIFIFNLALADFLVIVFCVPGNLLSNILNTWVLGLFMCKALNYMQLVCMNVTVYTLLAMSVERYIVMRRNSSFQRIVNMCGKIILACIWVFSLAVSIPSALYAIHYENQALNYMQLVCMNVTVYTLLAMSVERYIVMRRNSSFQRIVNMCGKIILACIWVFSLAVSIPSALYAIHYENQFCIENWPSEKIRKIYFIFAHLIMSYTFPMGMMTICHFWIWLNFHRQVVGKRIDPNELIRLNNWREWEKMILVLVSVFFLCWLPSFIVIILMNFSSHFSHGEIYMFSYVLLVTQWLANLTNCVYPIIYVFFKRNFREGCNQPQDELLTAEIELRQMLPPPTQLPPSAPFHKGDPS